ncbi:ribonuclease P protein component 1 [Natronococcus sp. JC468]|uniref:ribonuclease P protein component 1 n=1 Tax=Natronococcus sp. JC468 TaxID=1961921 RepID=UPI00143B6B79|nr:ribonuclease P protein component 1 [Natronococcus sp. JC468]NKE35561.1 ribonuclease P protein component 1 [Natronococcus sp. JC468]
MALTPETLPRHELNGLPVRVVESDDASRVGLEGRVVVETTNTLSVEVCVPPEAERDRGGNAAECGEGASRVVMVPKSGSTFEFAITDDAADAAKASGTASKLADAKPEPKEVSSAGSDCAGEGVAYVTVDGSRLLSQPARRTETNGDSPWQ